MFGNSTGEVDTVDLPLDVNKGRHILHTGGRHESYLLLPIVPEQG